MAELSFNDIRWKLEDAIAEMFPSAQAEIASTPEPATPYIIDIYSDYAIIETYENGEWLYWKAAYNVDGDSVLAPRSEWEEAESRSEWIAKAWERLAKARSPKTDEAILFDIDAPCGKKTIKIIDVDSRRIGAYATIWGELDCDGERMTRKALEPSFAMIKAKEALPWMFWKHGVDPKFGSSIIGVWDPDSFVMDELGMYVEGNLGDDDSGTKAFNTLQDVGAIGLSVGTAWYQVQREKAIDGTVNITQWPLLEISVMEGGKQCVPSARRDFKNKILKGLLDDVSIKMGLDPNRNSELETSRLSPEQHAAIRKLVILI